MAFAHHIKALPPALRAMRAMGYEAPDCLDGTGINEVQLVTGEAPFTLRQELRFHRNLLALTDDPLLGLSIGEAYTLETYGLFGYAFMSAPTLRQAMTVTANYGPLTYTLFRIRFDVAGNVARLQFLPADPIPEDLLPFYADRDLSAARYGGTNVLGRDFGIDEVWLPHDGQGFRQRYRDYFACDVTFGASCAALLFGADKLDAPLPLADPETSSLCQQQCQMLLARLSQRSGLAERVREIIVGRPGYFPDIDAVAERLSMTTRTLRRHLANEKSSYQQILTEVREGLALEYLSSSSLPIEEIASLLGYSAPGNFTNAFKRWRGCSPREYRQKQQAPVSDN
jgi:AraC-like DNA-binding protein